MPPFIFISFCSRSAESTGEISLIEAVYVCFSMLLHSILPQMYGKKLRKGDFCWKKIPKKLMPFLQIEITHWFIERNTILRHLRHKKKWKERKERLSPCTPYIKKRAEKKENLPEGINFSSFRFMTATQYNRARSRPLDYGVRFMRYAGARKAVSRMSQMSRYKIFLHVHTHT